MTTAAEVKKWIAPILERRPELVLVGKNLVIRPLQHILRGIYFDSSWDKSLCRPIWYVNKLVHHRGEESSFSFQYCGRFHIGRSSDADFSKNFVLRTEGALGLEFSSIQNIEGFLSGTERLASRGHGVQTPPVASKLFYDATTLAALGRIAEAYQLVAPALDAVERSRRSQLARSEAEFVKRANSAVGKLEAGYAMEDLAVIEKLRPFMMLLESGDRAGIGAMLRQWEEQTVKGWKLEHLWEPTPFPVELGEGG